MTAPGAVPILMYHSLDGSGSVVSIAPERFAAHVDVLVRRGFTGIALERLLDGWAGRAALPPRPVVLTFDDAYANLLPAGLPPLAEAGFTATVFVVTGRCGGDSAWPGQGAGAPALPLLDWDGLGRLAGAGWEIGAHTRHHPRLPGLSTAQLEDEVGGSRSDLVQRLGVTPRSFAYPYGLLDDTAREVAARHFEAAVSVRLGVARSDHDRFALPRLDAFYFRSPALLARLGTPVGAAWIGLRRLARVARGRLTSQPDR